MKRGGKVGSRYTATVYPDGRWYVERWDHVGYDYGSTTTVAHGTASTAAKAERAAQDAITNDKARRALEAQARQPLKTFTVDV